MNKLLFLLCPLLFISTLVSAQQTATTQNGRTVILYEDGYWRYSNEKDENFQSDNSESQSDPNSCKSLVKSKINMTSRSLSFHSKTQTEGNEDQFTYQWMFDKKEGISLELILNGTCVRYGDHVKLHVGNYSQVLQVQNQQESNCEGKMNFSFESNSKSLQTISSNKIKSIEIETKDGKVKEDIDGVTFSKTCECISKIAANIK